MRRWNLPQVNTKVMCAVLTAAMIMTGFTAKVHQVFAILSESWSIFYDISSCDKE